MNKDLPVAVHPLGRPAAIAALAAGEQNKFWEYHDKVMQNSSALSQQKLLDFAKELGLDMDAFQKSLMDPKHEKHINKDVQDAIRAGVNSTPTVFVNGRIVINRTLGGMNAMIAEEVQKKTKK